MFEKLFNLPVVFIGIFLGFVFFTAGMGRLTHGHYFPLTMFPISLAKLLEPDGELSFIGNRHLGSLSRAARGSRFCKKRS